MPLLLKLSPSFPFFCFRCAIKQSEKRGERIEKTRAEQAGNVKSDSLPSIFFRGIPPDGRWSLIDVHKSNEILLPRLFFPKLIPSNCLNCMEMLNFDICALGTAKFVFVNLKAHTYRGQIEVNHAQIITKPVTSTPI